MVGLIVDSGYERLSSTISTTISKMALLCAKTKLKICFSRPNHVGPYSRNSILEND